MPPLSRNLLLLLMLSILVLRLLCMRSLPLLRLLLIPLFLFLLLLLTKPAYKKDQGHGKWLSGTYHSQWLPLPRLPKSGTPDHPTSCPTFLCHDMDRIVPPVKTPRPRYDVFISHRGVDTKRNVASLLYHHLMHLELKPFLDCYSIIPGEKLHDKIKEAILGCKVGVVIFSPRYCESKYCLQELALLMETKKVVIPVFFDVTPSQLRNGCHGRYDNYTSSKVMGWRSALEEATRTLGLTFDSSKGDWETLLEDTSEAIMKYL